ncbi:unnamed protein product [Tuber aestivum]|uniref:C2H2-type domain-containing protein n=1 Tax=Tuber aestivum TaxID=59557 RepID=A0A292PR93_9PEZI|nr:unnamed protein product [Tuber aestivum]
MAIENRQRHPLHSGTFGGFQPPNLGPVQFTNPWTSASPQNHLIPSIPDVGGLGSLVKPDLRSSTVSASYQTIPTTAGIPTSNPGRNMSSPTLLPHHSDFMKGDLLSFNANSPFGGDISMSGSSAPSPTAVTSYSGVHSFAPTLDFSTHHSRTSYPLSNNDRRMSQPAMSNTMFLGSPVEPPRQRQNSLMEWTSSRPLAQPPRSTDHHQFSDTLDSARGMVAMSQASRQPRGRADGSHNFYPGHSTNSSISSTGSYNGYYGGGSVDSSATDYSDSTGFPSEAPRPTLPRLGTGIHSVPGQGALMTTFSSKITSSTQKKHKCKVCEKRFTRPSSLQTHTYSHTGEKPFACEVDGCGRKFSVVSNLRRHKKVHSSKNP